MIYSVHQPHYLPYPGYLLKVARSDVFVFLEKVQYVRREYQNRNKVKGPQGSKWLTVPVKGEYKSSIDSMLVDDESNWREQHESVLKQFYHKAEHLNLLDGFLEIINQEYTNLAELLIRSTEFFIHSFNLNTRIIRQSEFIDLPELPNERIIEIGNRLNAETYLAGSGGRNYMDTELFQKSGIEVDFMSFVPQPYPQLHGDFIPNLGAIDLLLCNGQDGFQRYIFA